MKKQTMTILSLGAVLAAAGAARGAFMSDFDAHTSGTILQDVDGWKGWDNVANSAGVVSEAYAYSGSSSIQIHGYTDAVLPFAGATEGVWSLSMKQYIPSGQHGLTYAIVMNRYADGGNSNAGYWSQQLKFNLGAGTVRDDFRGGTLPIVTDQWVDLRFDVDLDADLVSTYYNGALLGSGTWTRNGASVLAIAALDLYSAANNDAYYDDVSLTRLDIPSPGAPALAMCGGLFAISRVGATRRQRARAAH